MRILIERSRENAVRLTTYFLLKAIRENPAATLGLATGGTMLAVYDRLVNLIQHEEMDCRQLQTFNLDEYVGLEPDHPGSYHTYMTNCFFQPLQIPYENTNLPRGDAPDPDAEADAYEAAIEKQGGIDLQLLGIGKNGHIGFNEPTSSLGSRTRVKTLAKFTRDANRAYFTDVAEVPRLAITMGIGTILDSRECLLLATGVEKSSAVANMIEGPISASCPASALQLHQRVTVVLDEDAASELKNIDYYRDVHPPAELEG